MSDYDYDDEMSDESGCPFDDDEPYGGVFDDYLDGESSVSAKDFRDFKGRPMPTFEKEVKKRGFERFVVDMTASRTTRCTCSGKRSVVKGEFNFSGSFTAPAFHWFLSCGWLSGLNPLRHPKVTSKVINALDDKGNSALYYCHYEHYEQGWIFGQDIMKQLISDERFCAVDFPLMPTYGGGQDPLHLPGRKVLALLKRNLALPKTQAAKKLRATVNSIREGCSLLHMVCDGILIEPTKCVVEIHAALTGEHVASLPVRGDEVVGSLESKLHLSKKRVKHGPVKFVNSKGAVLEHGDMLETINAKSPSPRTARSSEEGGHPVQVYTVIVRSDDSGSIAASLVRLIRSHPEFERVNHVACEDERGGFGNQSSHHVQRETCLRAVLRKVHSPARAKVVQELLKRHPSGDRSRDFQVTDADVLAALAEDNGYPSKIVEDIRRRGQEPPPLKKPAAGAKSAMKRPARKSSKVKPSVAKKPAGTRMARATGKR